LSISDEVIGIEDIRDWVDDKIGDDLVEGFNSVGDGIGDDMTLCVGRCIPCMLPETEVSSVVIFEVIFVPVRNFAVVIGLR
jgi:hypothetical protein